MANKYYSKHKRSLMELADFAQTGKKKPPSKKKKNPYPPGSARAKLWDRREFVGSPK